MGLRYPHLLQAISLGSHEIRNRVVMGAMHTGLEELGDTERLAVFYAERARGGVGLIITGGYAPNFRGRLTLTGSQFSSGRHVQKHRAVTQAVHQEGGRICLQLLHAGRYAFHPFAVAPSRIKAPISPFTPWAMSKRQIRNTIADFVRSAVHARSAEYDGVEIMGSEGYLIHQFICRHSNHRQDEWGGSIENRCRFAIDIVRGIREAVGVEFILIFRLSMLDLLEQGSSWQEVVYLAKQLEQAGVTVINTGIGWHEVRIPTIAAMVPRAAFTWVTQRLKEEVSVPLITSNRINTPEVAEQVLAEGHADMVSMARPLLADSDFVNKAERDEAQLINTCIACNQACLDNVFERKVASCMVNPRACHETGFAITPAASSKKIVVIGLGPAGMAFAVTAAERGHEVIAYEGGEIGGQLNLAKRIPGKQEFAETIRYHTERMKQLGVEVHANHRVTEDELKKIEANEYVFATGVTPRKPQIEGIEHASVVTYDQVISGEVAITGDVAIIGAGGIGVDVAEFLIGGDGDRANDDTDGWLQSWGIDKNYISRGGLGSAKEHRTQRSITLLQRKPERIGKRLGKTTGWIHRLELKRTGIRALSGVEYQRIDDAGLHLRTDGEIVCLAVDHIILCAGQQSENSIYQAMNKMDKSCHLIGGAEEARELDAVAAIRDGFELGLKV